MSPERLAEIRERLVAGAAMSEPMSDKALAEVRHDLEDMTSDTFPRRCPCGVGHGGVLLQSDYCSEHGGHIALLFAEVERLRAIYGGLPDAARLQARIDAALALHQSHHVYLNSFDPIGGYICGACGEPVESEPCPTVRALRGDDA